MYLRHRVDEMGSPYTEGTVHIDISRPILVLECSCVLSLVLQSMQGKRVVDPVRLWSWLTICLDWMRLLGARSLATGEHTLQEVARQDATRQNVVG
jgi:hypothetical protein